MSENGTQCESFIADEVVFAKKPLSVFCGSVYKSKKTSHDYNNAFLNDSEEKTKKRAPIAIYQINLQAFLSSSKECFEKMLYRLKIMCYTHVLVSGCKDTPSLKLFIKTMHRGGIGVLLDCEAFNNEIKSLKGYHAFINEYDPDGIRLYCDSDTVLSLAIERKDLLFLIDENLTTPEIRLKKNVTVLNESLAEKILNYFSTDPINRKAIHSTLLQPQALGSCPLCNIPFSESLLSNGAGGLIGRMFGSFEDKFLNARLAFLYVTVISGVRLSFMGAEIAELFPCMNGKNYEHSLFDFDTDDPFQSYVSSLNRFCLTHESLWEGRFDGEVRLLLSDPEKNLLVIERSFENNDGLIAVFNFSGVHQNIPCSVFRSAHLSPVFDTGNIGEDFGFVTDLSGGETILSLPRLSGVVFSEIKEKLIKL